MQFSVEMKFILLNSMYMVVHIYMVRIQARSQNFYKVGGHEDGGTEDPERGVEARSAEGVRSGDGRRSPSPV